MPYFCMRNYSHSTIKLFDFNINGIGDSCSIYLFAFANHMYIFTVLNCMDEPHEIKSRIVVFYAYFIEFFVYIGVFFIAYFSTFQDTHEIFIDRPGETIFMTIGKAC